MKCLKIEISIFGEVSIFGAQRANSSAPCAAAGFGSYNRTDTIGAGPLRIQVGHVCGHACGRACGYVCSPCVKNGRVPAADMRVDMLARVSGHHCRYVLRQVCTGLAAAGEKHS